MRKEDIIKTQLISIYGTLAHTKPYIDITELKRNYTDIDTASFQQLCTQPNLTQQLKKELEKHVKGYITCHIVEDTLIVTIQATDRIIFRYTQNHVTLFQCVDVTKYAEFILEKHYFPYIANIFIKGEKNENNR